MYVSYVRKYVSMYLVTLCEDEMEDGKEKEQEKETRKRKEKKNRVCCMSIYV